MAVAFVDSNFGGEDSSNNITPAGADRFIVCAVCSDLAADPALGNVSFNTSETLTFDSSTGGSTGQWIELWRLDDPTTATAPCTVAGGIGDNAVIALTVSGALSVTVQAAQESGGATNLSVNVPDMTADDLAFAFIHTNGAMAGYTPDGTEREMSSSAGQSYALLTKAGTGTVSIGGTGWTSSRCSIIAGRLVGAGGGGGGATLIVPTLIQNYRNMGYMR